MLSCDIIFFRSMRNDLIYIFVFIGSVKVNLNTLCSGSRLTLTKKNHSIFSQKRFKEFDQIFLRCSCRIKSCLMKKVFIFEKEDAKKMFGESFDSSQAKN